MGRTWKPWPGILLTWIDLAQAWAAQGEMERALEILERYTRQATGDIYPLRLHGDGFLPCWTDGLSRPLPWAIIRPGRNPSSAAA